MNKLQKKAFKRLLHLSREKKEDGKSNILPRVALEVGVYLISSLTRRELGASKVYQLFETLEEFGENFGDYAYTSPLPANRAQEALIALHEVGLIKLGKEESTSYEREELGYRKKTQVWKWEIDLTRFVFDLEDKDG